VKKGNLTTDEIEKIARDYVYRFEDEMSHTTLAIAEALRLQRERIVADLRVAAEDKGLIGTARDPKDALNDFADCLERNS
jgi:transcription initiation factor TFIIIB Brf1 subunit/transcription initiation factor TFIIB